jgi:hypothetical protein
MYAGHDGNVYKNTGSGWQKYNNGSWNSVNTPSHSASQESLASGSRTETQQRAESYGNRGSFVGESQNLQQESQNRQRGAQSSQRFEQRSAGGFSGAGGRRR